MFVIEGSFKINSYTVTYKVDGEISGEAETYKYGAVVTLRGENLQKKVIRSVTGAVSQDLRCLQKI